MDSKRPWIFLFQSMVALNPWELPSPDSGWGREDIPRRVPGKKWDAVERVLTGLVAPRSRWVSGFFLVTVLSFFTGFCLAEAPRTRIPLNGDWLFQTNGAPADQWKIVRVPSEWETHEGTNFNGIGWYRREIKSLAAPTGKRVLLHFQAAATEAEVWWNGKRLGSHLGGWTPFRFDVTEALRGAPAGKPQRIRVRLDEKVGHNTQGFLPIIEPHFGGLWQPVELWIVPGIYIDDLQLRASGNPKTGRIELELPLAGKSAEPITGLRVRFRLRGQTRWQSFQLGASADASVPPNAWLERNGNILTAQVPVREPKLWSPAEPNLYEVEIALAATLASAPAGDKVRTTAAFRSIEAVGSQLRLNGHPFNVRGVLNWGYYPPRLAPDPGEAVFRRDLEFARAYGFNLMKFCLWVPPRRFLELADEMGVLTWMEYPTWHPQFTAEHLEALRREFREFVAYDRNNPSVVLRSLTCETGPSADLRVIRSLYDMAHEMIPGALVEDDSSWIEWNRVADFYDDHPYGNNHTWVPALRKLNDYIRTNELKPLVLGEAISADTWVPREPFAGRFRTQARPHWFPDNFDAQTQWLERMKGVAGPMGLEELIPDSLHYGLLMRKYQIEAFRREVPDGGYVVSEIRDVASASMGMIDYFGKPKWSAAQWAWQGDTMCMLKTANDRRSFSAGDRLAAEVLVSHFGNEALSNFDVSIVLERTGGARRAVARLRKSGLSQNPGTVVKVLDLDVPLAAVTGPTRLLVRCALKTGRVELKNEWPIWVVPEPRTLPSPAIRVHSSLSGEMARELFPEASPLGDGERPDGIVVAARFDAQLISILEKGGRVLLLPDGARNSLPLEAHWFLRGGPYIPGFRPIVPREFLVELQHFDLGSDVVPNLPYLEHIDPILMLWDTHGIPTIKTHGLVFATRAGQGRLLVSALRHRSATNAAGKWLLQVLLKELANGPAPKHALPEPLWQRIKDKIHEEKIPLVEKAWRFKPDPKNEGVQQGWALPGHADAAGWSEIRIGRSWESQGYPALDGWAWYRLRVQVPAHWTNRPVFLSFEGVDDCYELYINGRLAAKCGDPVTRQTTFDERRSHDLSALVKPGEPCLIAVRVFDWFGAGGIFRPVTLGTTALAPGGEILK